MLAAFEQFRNQWGPNAQLALDTIAIKSTQAIPSWVAHIMDPDILEEYAGYPTGSYREDTWRVYRDFQLAVGTCFIDQWIPDNALAMTSQGYDSATERKATTGAKTITIDGMVIDSPEKVVEHLEKYGFPASQKQCRIVDTTGAEIIDEYIQHEVKTQKWYGPNMLKTPYNVNFPRFSYNLYGYENYFLAYALFPEVMEKCFSLQADLAERENRLVAKAVIEGNLPPLIRLDHDMADARGMLVDIRSLDKIWMPHFIRSIKPLLDAGIRLIWHCDGNLMQLVPRLLDAGLSGFQGFQYECGMDYPKICKMKDRDGGPLLIIAGVSVTQTLPHGSKQDVIDHMNWLVEYGPPQGLFLGGSSSVTPGTNPENIRTFIEGLRYYREHGRNGRFA